MDQKLSRGSILGQRRFEIMGKQSVLSLIWWEDESQLIDQENFEEEERFVEIGP
jgi:hypothetical protein